LCTVCFRHHLQNFFNSNFFSPAPDSPFDL